MAAKRRISIQKGRRQTKHGFPIASPDRAAQDLTLSRYKEPAEPLEGRGRRLPQGRSCGGAWPSDRSNRRTMVGDFGSFGLHAHGGRRARYVTVRALSRDPHVSLAQYTIPDG
jgi:hypothetical protein